MDDNEKRRAQREDWSKLIEGIVFTVVVPAFLAWIIGQAFPKVDREVLLLIAGALSMGGLFVLIKRSGR